MSDEDRSADDDTDPLLENWGYGAVLSEDDLTADRLTKLFRHKRVHDVEETAEGFRFIFRDGTTVTVDPTVDVEIWGESDNKYTRQTERGPADTEGLSPESILELGDLVRLKDPFDPSAKCIKYTHGIVVEILQYFNVDRRDIHIPSRVSLHLYNPQTHDIYLDEHSPYRSPMFVDWHVRQLVLVQKATDSTYHARDIDIAEYLDLGDRR